jgi:hypothetical protein
MQVLYVRNFAERHTLSAYKDIAQRLEKMERLVTDFGLGHSPKGSIPESGETPVPESAQGTRTQILSKGSTVVLQSPVEESDFAWAVPETGQQNDANPKSRYLPEVSNSPLDSAHGKCFRR